MNNAPGCIEIAGNVFDAHTLAEAAIWATSNSNAGADAVEIHHNVFICRASPAVSVGATTVTTYGSMHHNLGYGADTGDWSITAKLALFENYFGTATIQKSGGLYPAVWASA